MQEEGLEIENTKQVCKRCTKPKLYEIVKIKSDFLDDTSIDDFRHCPSWKAICITIMKNDVALTYMGLGRTADQNILRQKAIEKYQMKQAMKALAKQEIEQEEQEAA